MGRGTGTAAFRSQRWNLNAAIPPSVFQMHLVQSSRVTAYDSKPDVVVTVHGNFAAEYTTHQPCILNAEDELPLRYQTIRVLSGLHAFTVPNQHIAMGIPMKLNARSGGKPNGIRR